MHVARQNIKMWFDICYDQLIVKLKNYDTFALIVAHHFSKVCDMKLKNILTASIIVAALYSSNTCLAQCTTDSRAISDTSVVAEWQHILPQQLSISLATGNAGALASHFNENIELTITDKSGIFSHKQAIVIIKDFFESSKPNDFKVIHERCLDNSTLTIGTLTTNESNYRVYILTNSENNRITIQQLRIENQDD